MLDKFLKIYSYIIIQQDTPAKNNINNNNNYQYLTKSKNDDRSLVLRLVAKLNAINNANNEFLENVRQENEGAIENHGAYKYANKDTDISVDISTIASEISYQQQIYDKVLTITSTPIKCQRRKHHQMKKTNSLLSLSSQPPIFSLTTTAAELMICTILSTPSIENYETILCHYVDDNLSFHKLKHSHHSNSMMNRRVLNIINSSSSRGTASSATSICQSVDQHGSATWIRSHTFSSLLLMLFIVLTIGIHSATAGACWQTLLDNGKCNEIFSLNISKDECCGANQEFAYTEREPTNVEYFFATAIGGGMECSPCLESCLNVICGPNKKCLKRKKIPKCVCAPECGAARRKRKQREHSMQQEQKILPKTHHYTSHLVSSHVKEDNNEDDNDSYFQNEPSSNAFKIKTEKSQQSRDTRSLSSEITNVNLGLDNRKDVITSSGLTSPGERHHWKEHNQNQRNLIHIHTHHSHEHRQQQQFNNQPNHKNQKPKGSRRLLITSNVEHTEKPTTRRLQIFSNVRTTQARRRNNNSNTNKYSKHGDSDLSDYYEGYDEDYNDAEDDAKSSNIHIGNSNKNSRNEDSKRFLNQSSSRHKLKTNIKSNNNKNRNKNQQHLQTTKIRENSNKNYTRVIRPQQNGRHVENNPHHHNHNHHQHHRHQQHQQQKEEKHHISNHRQQSQNHGRHKHYNSDKQQTIVLKKQNDNKDYNIATTITNTHIAVVNTASTKITAKHDNISNNDTYGSAIDASHSILLQTGIVKIATTPTPLNLSSSSSAAATTTTTTNSSSQGSQSLMLLFSSSTTYTSSSTILLNSTISVDNGAAADDHYHSHLPNHGSILATSSSLSAASFSSLPSTSPTPSTTPSSDLQISAVSAHSSSEPSVVTTMSAISEGVLLHDHYHNTEIQENSTHSNKNNNDDIISTLQSNLHNNHQQDQQHQTQPQSKHHYQTPLFDGISEQFDLIGLTNNKQQQRVTNGDNLRTLNPVCGTDGRTYNTECQLRKRACRTDNQNLQIAYLGHCRTTCNNIKCLNGLTCVEDQYAMPHCIACKIDCLQYDYDNYVVDAARAVCGADGKTYKSTCDINRMVCKNGRSVGVAYPGPCREDQVTCDDVSCGSKQVCLTDLLTHKPRCTSCRYKCSRKRRQSSPNFAEGKICGFNNRTYNSWCEMRKDSCSTGFYIDVKYAGDCH